MKKGITTLVGLAVFVVLVAFSSGAPPEATTASGEQSCGRSSCHNVSANQGDAALSLGITNMPESYEADMTYSLKIALADAKSAKNGFEIVALDAQNNNAGEWIISGTDIQERSGNSLADRKYITHTAAGNNQDQWSFDWKAPSSDVGDITFHIAAIDANENGTKTGDDLYAISLALPFATVSGLSSFDESNITVYPNPATDFIYLSNNNIPSQQIHIYNINGQLVKQLQANTRSIDVRELDAGLYFLQLRNETSVRTKQFLIQK